MPWLAEMKYHAQGIRKVQKELGLEVESFPNLGMDGAYDDDQLVAYDIEEATYDFEGPAHLRWKERMNPYYSP